MKVISKAEAKQAGLSRYFSGHACKNGHVAERTLAGNCCECRKDYYQKRKALGICSSCGKASRTDRTTCFDCNKKICSKLSKKIASRAYTLKIKEEVFSAYGGRCICCHENDTAFLTIDHIHGGGTQHRKEIGGGIKIYLWLRKHGYPAGYQVMCFNCNWAKHLLGQCPHQTRTKARP